MVVGNGLVANLFKSYILKDEFIIFASGVSNSKNIDPFEYDREFNLLKNTIQKHKNKSLVYFSTCSIYDPEEVNSAYVLHKLNLENFIQAQQERFYIFRESNLVGNTSNKNTIINYLTNHIRNQNHFNLWENAERNLLDVDDMFVIVDHILQMGKFSNNIINIANPLNYKVVDIVKAIENTFNLKASYTKIKKGQPFKIDISMIFPIINERKIQFGENYLEKLLKKYSLPHDLSSSNS